jgi:hypothetical protein
MAVGFLLVFGAVGTLEINPEASVLVQAAIAAVGLIIASSGVRAMKAAQ